MDCVELKELRCIHLHERPAPNTGIIADLFTEHTLHDPNTTENRTSHFNVRIENLTILLNQIRNSTMDERGRIRLRISSEEFLLNPRTILFYLSNGPSKESPATIWNYNSDAMCSNEIVFERFNIVLNMLEPPPAAEEQVLDERDPAAVGGALLIGVDEQPQERPLFNRRTQAALMLLSAVVCVGLIAHFTTQLKERLPKPLLGASVQLQD